MSKALNSKEILKEESDKKTAFFNGFKRAIDQWERSHPGQMPPVIQDKDGNWQWVNRKERRKLEKRAKNRR